VTSETSAKVRELLQDALSRKLSIWRQVNHPSPGGADIPVLYSAVNIGRDDRFVVVGRDLRPLAAMQQRLVNAQQSMERDYVRLRQAETRYRLLFQVSSEAVMIVDAASNAILEINPAALALLDASAPQVVKTNLSSHFDAADAEPVQTLLSNVRALSPHPSSGRRTRPCFWSACPRN
jgi:PAS domain-containing protein